MTREIGRFCGTGILATMFSLACGQSGVSQRDTGISESGGSDAPVPVGEVAFGGYEEGSGRETATGYGFDAGLDGARGSEVAGPDDGIDALAFESGVGGDDSVADGIGDGNTADAGASPAAGQSCVGSGSLACGGSAQNRALICSGGTWQVRATCPAGQNCDRSSGVCTNIVSACDGHAPGYAFCSNDVVAVCGPDLVSLSTTLCGGTCRDGACQPSICGDGKLAPGEECDDGNPTPADGCEPDCKLSKVIQLTAGLTHTCALLREGLVRCWGGNDSGQLGLATAADLSGQKPYENGVVALGAPAVAIAAGEQHTCVLMQDSSVRCWGNNAVGQLGLGHTQSIGDDEAPDAQHAQVPLGAPVKAIAAGGNVTCAILQTGDLRCWGRNHFGQLGLGHTDDIGDDETPSAAVATVALDDTVRAVAPGGDHTCVVLDNNNTRCWGRNDVDQLGIPNSTEQIGDNELPTAVPALEWPGYTQFGTIAAGATRTFAWLSDESAVRIWGDNSDGGFGYGWVGNYPELSPTEWGGLTYSAPILSIAVGAFHACALLWNQELRCFGENSQAQLGQPNIQTIGDVISTGLAPPVDLGLDAGGKAMFATLAAAGALHTCVLLNTGLVRCWGYNANGQLGLGFASGPPGLDYVGGTPDSVPALLDPVRVFGPGN